MDPSQPVSSPASSCHLHALTGRVMSTMLGLRAHSPLWLCRPTLQMAACSFHTQTFTKCTGKKKEEGEPAKFPEDDPEEKIDFSLTEYNSNYARCVSFRAERGGGALMEKKQSQTGT